jgi:hypothetical protein
VSFPQIGRSPTKKQQQPEVVCVFLILVQQSFDDGGVRVLAGASAATAALRGALVRFCGFDAHTQQQSRWQRQR